MINRRRCLSLCLAVALGLALAFSCLGSTVKITHLSSGAHSESWQNFLREMKEPFEKANPGYEIEILTDSTPNEKFLVMVAGGISPDVLDLVISRVGASYRRRYVLRSQQVPRSPIEESYSAGHVECSDHSQRTPVHAAYRGVLDRHLV